MVLIVTVVVLSVTKVAAQQTPSAAGEDLQPEAGGEEAVAKRLGPMCVVQFRLDGQKVQKLKGLKETGTWEQTEYVKKQGWATMPGEKEPDNKVAGECAKLLLLMS